MDIRSISWLGIRTNAFPEMVGFFRDVLEVELEYESPEIMSFMLRNGDLVEIIGPGDRGHDDFPLTPVPGFLKPMRAAWSGSRGMSVVLRPGASGNTFQPNDA